MNRPTEKRVHETDRSTDRPTDQPTEVTILDVNRPTALIRTNDRNEPNQPTDRPTDHVTELQ